MVKSSKKILVREYGREYSLFRTSILNQVINHDMVEFLKPLDICGSYAIYHGRGLVYGYHCDSDISKVFVRLAEVAQDVDQMNTILEEGEKLFAWLKPYYDKEIYITNREELQNFYRKYTRFYFLHGVIIQGLPRTSAPENIKKHALNLRKQMQEYNEHAEIVFANAFGVLYQNIGDDWRFILPDEVWDGSVELDSISSKVDQRKKGYVMYRDFFKAGSKISVLLDELGVTLHDDTLDTSTSEIKGQTAYKGVVRGTVKIIDSADLLDIVFEGDVLVATMTMPRYLPAMKKASAFITDEGGITCHAAIISRELKKPCIIGTKIATQVLKSGDEVEVDADNGVVRVLKRMGHG